MQTTKEFIKDNMKVKIYSSRKDMGKAAAYEIKERIVAILKTMALAKFMAKEITRCRP